MASRVYGNSTQVDPRVETAKKVGSLLFRKVLPIVLGTIGGLAIVGAITLSHGVLIALLVAAVASPMIYDVGRELSAPDVAKLKQTLDKLDKAKKDLELENDMLMHRGIWARLNNYAVTVQ